MCLDVCQAATFHEDVDVESNAGGREYAPLLEEMGYESTQLG